MKQVTREFFDFLKEYKVVGLAVAVMIGGKLNELVSSLVNDLITPLILKPALTAAKVDNIKQLSYNGILYGKVLGTLIDFFTVAIIVFLIAKFLFKEEKVSKK